MLKTILLYIIKNIMGVTKINSHNLMSFDRMNTMYNNTLSYLDMLIKNIPETKWVIDISSKYESVNSDNREIITISKINKNDLELYIDIKKYIIVSKVKWGFAINYDHFDDDWVQNTISILIDKQNKITQAKPIFKIIDDWNFSTSLYDYTLKLLDLGESRFLDIISNKKKETEESIKEKTINSMKDLEKIFELKSLVN